MRDDQLVWLPDAEARINKAPFFVRKLARKRVEKAALEQGVLDFVLAVKSQQMPS